MSFFFFFNDTATTEIYTLSLHDALPICLLGRPGHQRCPALDEEQGRPALRLHGQPGPTRRGRLRRNPPQGHGVRRSEEHTSELQSPCNLVCRLLLEKKQTTRSAADRTTE